MIQGELISIDATYNRQWEPIENTVQRTITQHSGRIKIRATDDGQHQLIDGHGNAMFTIETDDKIGFFRNRGNSKLIISVAREKDDILFNQHTITARILTLNYL